MQAWQNSTSAKVTIEEENCPPENPDDTEKNLENDHGYYHHDHGDGDHSFPESDQYLRDVDHDDHENVVRMNPNATAAEIPIHSEQKKGSQTDVGAHSTEREIENL